MTTAQLLSMLLMPAAALIIAGVALYVTRKDREHLHPGE